MPNKIYVFLDKNEFEALLKSAVINLREPKEEARFLIRQELIRRRLLHDKTDNSTLANEGDND